MKKIVATALICAMMFSLAACSGKQPETTITETSETTTLVTETTQAAETTAAQTSETTADATTASKNAAGLNKEDYVKNAQSKYKSYVNGSDSYCAPEILIKSSYADSVNKEIQKRFEKIKKELKSDNEIDIEISGTEYIAYLTKDGILSVAFIERRSKTLVHVYNIDVKTGEKVDNARLAEIAGVKSIRTAAMDALQNEYNSIHENFYGASAGRKVENYKVKPENGKKLNEDERGKQATFGEKYLNDNMKVGLTDEGKMFFVITLFDALLYERYVLDADGNDLRKKDNPALVAPKGS